MNGGMSQLDHMEAMARHARIKKEADRLGPILYEVRLRKRKSAAQRVSAFAAAQFARVQSSLLSLVRGEMQADRQSAQ